MATPSAGPGSGIEGADNRPSPTEDGPEQRQAHRGAGVNGRGGFCSRFGRYRHLHPSPRAKRGQYLSARGFSFLGVFGCSKQGQPDALKAAGLCRACLRFLENLGWNPFFTLRAGRDMPGFG